MTGVDYKDPKGLPERGRMVPTRAIQLLYPTLAVVLLAFSLTSAEQKTEEQKPIESELSERVDVRLVQITIFAVDEDGRPVKDLKPAEVVVKDKRKRINIAFLDPFEEEERSPVTVRLFINVPGGPARPITGNGGTGRYYILYLDVENQPLLDRQGVATAALQFVERDFNASDQVAVVSFNGEIKLEASFTTSREETVAAVAKAYERSSSPRLGRTRRMRDLLTRLRGCSSDSCISMAMSSYALEMRHHAEDFLRTLEGIIRYAGGLHGRKAVLAVTHGVALDPQRELDEAIEYTQGIGALNSPSLGDEGAANLHKLDRISDLAIQQNVALHFITQPPHGIGTFGAHAGSPGSPGASPFEASQAQAQTEMQHIADSTGGRVVIADDPYRGLQEALSLERSGYVLGYYLDKPPEPNQFRRVKIESNRKGVRIIGPRGYYQSREPKKTVDGTLVLGDTPSPGSMGRQRIPFTMRVNPRELGYKVKKGEAGTNFTLETSVLHEKGRLLARTYHFINHAYGPQDWKSKDVEPLQISGWVELPPGRYELRAIIRNPKAETQGRYSQVILVP